MKVLDLYAGTGSATQAFEDRGHDVRSVEKDEAFDGIDHYCDMRAFARNPRKWLGDWTPDVSHNSPPCYAFAMAGSGSKAAWDRAQAGNPKPSDPPLSEFRWHYEQGHGFYGKRTPNDQRAVLGCELVLCALATVRELEPTYWWIENPMGGLRTMGFMEALVGEPPNGREAFVEERPSYVSEGLARWILDVDAEHHDVTYCQYWNPRLDVEPQPRMKRTDLWGSFPDWWEPRKKCKNGYPCHEAAPRGSDTGTQALDPKDRARVPYELGNDLARACEVALGL